MGVKFINSDREQLNTSGAPTRTEKERKGALRIMEDSRIYKEDVLIVDKESFERFIEANKLMARQFVRLLSIADDLVNQLNRMDSRLQALDGLVGLIRENSGAISTSLKIKESAKTIKYGAESPAYKQGVDMEELKNAYIENNYVCDNDFLDKYTRKYNVTSMTLRNRLKAMGVYRGHKGR